MLLDILPVLGEPPPNKDVMILWSLGRIPCEMPEVWNLDTSGPFPICFLSLYLKEIQIVS